MTSRALAPLAVAALSGAVVLSASAGPPPGHPSAKRHCRNGRIAVRGTAGARRLTVGGKRAPIIACVKPLPNRPEGGYRAVERLLDSPRLVDPRLRRAERGLRAHNRKLGRALRRGNRVADRATLDAHADPTPLARAARRTRTGPLPDVSIGGVTATGHGVVVEPDDDEEGQVVETDYTARVPLDRGEIVLRNLDRKGAFVKHCPDAQGQAKGEVEFRELRSKTETAIGRSLVTSQDWRVTATVVGHVNDDAELVDYDVEGEFVVESKGHLEVAATGKLLQHAPTQVIRGRFAMAGVGGKLSNLRGGAVGPHGRLSGRQLEAYWTMSWLYADEQADRVFDHAEEYWRETYDKATGEEGGHCVRLEYSPNPLEVGAGETKSFEARLVSKQDGAEVAAKHKVGDYGPQGYARYPTAGTTTPQAATSAPGSPAVFQHTAPTPAPEKWATINELATSKRGIAVATHFATRPPPVPRAYVGTVSGYHHEAGGGATENEDWTATGLRFDRTGGSDNSPSYALTQGTVHWSYSYDSPVTGCTGSGSATFNAVGGSAGAEIDFADPSQYHGVGDYYREGMTTLTCPPDYSASGPRQAFAEWWSTNANEGGFSATGPNWKLQGQATNSSGAIHYEWSLTPVF